MPRGRYPIAKLAKDYDRVVVQKGLCELPDDGHKPLVTVLSFSSLGFRTAMSSPLSASLTAHVLSTPEYSYFVSLHADRTVLRIACQHALNPAETLAIAEELGLDHPAIFSGSETIMSTDFMVLNSTSAVPTWRICSTRASSAWSAVLGVPARFSTSSSSAVICPCNCGWHSPGRSIESAPFMNHLLPFFLLLIAAERRSPIRRCRFVSSTPSATLCSTRVSSQYGT